MPRAFLYGGAWSVTLVAIRAWTLLIDQSINPKLVVIASVLFSVLAVVFFQLAKRGKPIRSKFRAVIEWFVGFFLVGPIIGFGLIWINDTFHVIPVLAN